MQDIIQAQKSGKLFLIPTYLSTDNTPDILAPIIHELIKNTKHYLVENARTSRRFISSLKLGVDIESLRIHKLDKNTGTKELYELLKPLKEGVDVGLMSEAGLPAIADPGQVAVSMAHQLKIPVVPLPGPSSIIQALIASGFDGQKFTFHGYLPIDKSKRKTTLLNIEKTVEKTGYTQIFMETPYRNNALIESLTGVLKRSTYLSIASGITSNSEFIYTALISKWKNEKVRIDKIPAIFSIGIPQ